MQKKFHNFVFGVSVLPALLVMPAIAGEANITDIAWVFGDVTIPAGQPIDLMGFGGRRMSAAEHKVDGKYRNDFPAYNMLGQSLTVMAGEGESLSPLYVGPVNLTLQKLGDENFKYNYQWGADGETDIDLAVEPTKLTEEQLQALGLEEPLTRIGWNDPAAVAKVAAVIGEGNAAGTAGGVVLFSHKDSNAANDGVLSLGKTNAVIDGTTVNAKKIDVTNSSLKIANKDTTLLADASVWYTIKEKISSTGVTTLNADTISIDASTVEVKPEATLVINNVTPNGTTTFKNTSTDYGALTVNGNGSLLLGGNKLVFDDNTSTSHGAALYFKDQTAGDNAARLIAKNITFSDNTSDYTASSGGAVFSSGGNMSILGENNTFTGNKILGTDVAAKLHKRGGGAVANQSYELETSWAKVLSTAEHAGDPIDATMVIGKEDGSSINLFENNTSSMNGGAVMNRSVDTDGNAYLTINGTTTFDKNTAALNGGALYNFADTGKTAEVTMTNGTYTFTDNTASKNGGAIYNTGTMNIANAEFTGNGATETGGAVYNKGEMTISKALFENNVSSGDAGAIAARGKENLVSEETDMADLTINNVTFKSNTANLTSGIGGALVAERNSKVTIEDSEFTGNKAAWGGAVYSYATSENNGHSVGGYVTVKNTKFSNNEALGVGALGIFSEATIKGAVFENNRATASDDDGAGALFFGSVSKSDMLLSGSTFTSNSSASVGGAIATRGSGADGVSAGNNTDALLDISDVTFTSNTAATKGGAFYNAFHGSTKHNGYVTLSDATFVENEAADGGAIYNSAAGAKDSVGGKIYGTNLTFRDNSASANGGAIYNNIEFVLSGVNSFSGNKANNVANDIYNVGALTIASGTTTIDGGISGTGTLTIANDATLNIGTASIEQDTISLIGNMFATLREGDAQIKATSFDGTGKLNLTMTKVGTYNVFDVTGFGSSWSDEHVVSTNPIYELLINNDGTVVASKKSAEDISADTGLKTDTAVAVSHVADAAAASESKQLQELSVKIQEKLVENTPEAMAAVEHATKAINPEKESVAQSVSTSVQNTVVNLASARMSAPSVGRNGGDVELTKGGVWAQGLFNKSKQADAFDGYTRGIALGSDATFNKHLTIGAGYSFAHSDISGTARDTKIDSNTIFLYGQYKPTEWYVNAIVNYTMSDYSERGTILDGIAVTGDYKVNSFGGALATGYNFKSGMTPELGLRYMHVSANDYANSYGIKTHMDDANFLTGVFGAKYAFDIAATRNLTFAPQLNAAVKYDLLSNKNIATVAMPGLDAYTLEGRRLNRIGGEFGIGLGMQYRDFDLSVNYDIDVREDYTSQTGMLKFRYNF